MGAKPHPGFCVGPARFVVRGKPIFAVLAGARLFHMEGNTQRPKPPRLSPRSVGGPGHILARGPTPDSANHIRSRSFRDELLYHRDVLDADGVAPDAHAGGVPNRVGDRTDCTGDADLADALHAKRVDMGIIFMDEDRLH
jgi:hypothetical protein